MSILKTLDIAIKALDLSGPPRIFVVNMPFETMRISGAAVADVLSNYPFHELGHRVLVLEHGISLSELNDLQLRNLGLMRIMEASPPPPGTKAQ